MSATLAKTGGKYVVSNIPSPYGHAPYSRLFESIRNHVPKEWFDDMTCYDLAAFCIRMSMGESFFCACDSLYRKNLLDISTSTGVDQRKFLAEITVAIGLNKGAIPKFRFDSNVYRIIQQDETYSNEPLERKALAACNVGIGQLSLYAVLKEIAPGFSDDYAKTFLRDEPMQLREIMRELKRIYKRSNGQKSLAFTRMHCDSNAVHASERGQKTLDLANHLEHLYNNN